MLDPLSPIHLEAALARLRQGFETLPPFEPSVDRAGIDQVLVEVATRLADNFPYPHPLYAGQMLKPPHPVALLAYSLALHLNPNNHAIDGGRASSRMEKEAVAQLARMVGWETHLGHLTGGGTMANLEALWVAGRLRPGKRIVASAQAHYTHSRISEVLGLPFASVANDHRGRMDLAALALELERGDVGTVVATMGTTALGAVDPLPDLLELQTRHRFRIHADAAYGGYFSLATNLGAEATAAFAALSGADSIVIDPHKHGLQPYGCGSVLFRDPGVGTLYRHDSPYTYFSSGDMHLGEISLECSRPGAAAVALWATQRLLPLEPGGAFGRGLAGSHRAAERLHQLLAGDPRFAALIPPELDIVCWGVRAPLATAASGLARALFEEAARQELHLALVTLPRALVVPWWPDLEWDQETVTCLRSCLMKPEHEEWLDRIWARLDAAANSVLSPQPPHPPIST
jgi:glutamate/tyrosine decarboxylase-like PLP-dependent enzyme